MNQANAAQAVTIQISSDDEKKELVRPTQTQIVNDLLYREGTGILEMLIGKNSQYDNAALTPIGIFAKKNALATVCVRIDDKLARLKHIFENYSEDHQPSYHDALRGEDTIADLIGYLLLLRVGSILERRRDEQEKRMLDMMQNNAQVQAYDPMDQLYARIEKVEAKVFETGDGANVVETTAVDDEVQVKRPTRRKKKTPTKAPTRRRRS